MALLPVIVELRIDDAWVDITADVYQRDPITVTAGRRDDQSIVDHTRGSLTINNRDGKYSTRNPLSPHFGKLGRNTPLRVRLPTVEHNVTDTFQRTVSNGWGTTDSGQAYTNVGGVAGDFAVSNGVASHVVGVANTFRVSYLAAALGENGEALLDWRLPVADVTGGLLEPANLVVRSTDSTAVNGYLFRVELDTAEQTIARIFNPAGVQVGSGNGPSAAGLTAGEPFRMRARWDGPDLRMRIWRVSTGEPAVWHAIAVDHGRLRAGGVGVRSGVAAGNTNVPVTFSYTGLTVSTWDIELDGEAVQWPPLWDLSGRDVWVPIEVAGIIRRLSQGAKTVTSPVRRRIIDAAFATQVAAYWPLEEQTTTGIRQTASAIGGPPLLVAGDVTFAADDVFPGSRALPSLRPGAILAGAVLATVETTGTVYLRLLVSATDDGSTTGDDLLTVLTTGSAQKWSLRYDSPNGSLNLRASARGASDYTTVAETTPVAFKINKRRVLLEVNLVQNGANVDTLISVRYLGGDNRVTAGSIWAQTFSSTTVGRAITAQVRCPAFLSSLVCGHLVVANDDQAFEAGTIDRFLTAWVDEPTAERVTRICAENTIPVSVQTVGKTAPAGFQPVSTLLAICRDAATADQGVLYETRQARALAYRSAGALSGQTPVVLDYTAGHLFAPFAPVDDDQAIVNDVTVTRPGGSVSRAMLTTGALSTQDPPAGVGIYDRGQATVNVGGDGQLPDVAHWLLGVGTIDEYRYPSITVNMAAPEYQANPVFATAVRRLDVGDLVRIIHPPAWLPPDDIDLVVQGYHKVLMRTGVQVTFNAVPAAPYRVGVYGTDRYDTSGSALASATTTTGPLVVATSNPDAAPLWTVADGSYDLMVGGERVTVTAVASAVTDTFTRSVSSGWGTATSRQAWTTTGGSASDYSVDGARGVILLPTGDTASRNTVLSDSYTDVEVTVRIRVSAVATGANLNGMLLLRRQDDSNYYRFVLVFNTGGNVDATIGRVLAGSASAIALANNVFGYSANQDINVRAQVFGTMLRMKVWTGAEPGGWTLTVTDSTFAAGLLACRAFQSVTNTNTNPTVGFDDLVVANPQQLTVTRSVNAIVKTHPAGTPVRLFRPVVAGLWSGPAAATGLAVKAADIPRSRDIAEPATTGGLDTTTSARRVDMAGAGSVTSMLFTKHHAHTVLRVFMAVSRFDQTAASNAAYGIYLGIRLGMNLEFDIIGAHFLNATADHQFAMATRDIANIPAGTYTVQARWRRVAGSGTLTRDVNDWLSLDITEVHTA